jgi:hypothetical protein
VWISSDGTTALVADFQANAITPVVLPALTSGPAIPIGANPTGIAAAAGASTAWVSAGQGVTPLTVATRQPGTAISVGAPAEAVAVAPNGHVWVGTADGTLVEVDPATSKVVRKITLAGLPSAIVIAPVSG